MTTYKNIGREELAEIAKQLGISLATLDAEIYSMTFGLLNITGSPEQFFLTPEGQVMIKSNTPCLSPRLDLDSPRPPRCKNLDNGHCRIGLNIITPYNYSLPDGGYGCCARNERETEYCYDDSQWVKRERG